MFDSLFTLFLLSSRDLKKEEKEEENYDTYAVVNRVDARSVAHDACARPARVAVVIPAMMVAAAVMMMRMRRMMTMRMMVATTPTCDRRRVVVVVAVAVCDIVVGVVGVVDSILLAGVDVEVGVAARVSAHIVIGCCCRRTANITSVSIGHHRVCVVRL